MSPRLFHFSEEPDIRVFVPRPPLAHPEMEPLVWAVDAWHAPHFLTPRDCPRACFWAGPDSSRDDVERFLGDKGRVLAIERQWLETLRSMTLYRYEFDPARFELVDETAGYYVSREVETPLRVRALDSLIGALDAAGVELRVVPDVMRLHLAVAGSTLMFSSSRLRNVGIGTTG